MSSSGEASDGQIIHILQPPVSRNTSGGQEKDMQSSVGGVFCPKEEAQQQPQLCQQHPISVQAPQRYTVEEQITTVRIPMRRPNSSFLEILHEGGADGEVFTMKEIIHHVKNYIIKHQLFDPVDPRVVHCQNHKLGEVFQVEQFSINEAISLFIKNTLPVPDSCIRITRQLVKKAIISQGAANTAGKSEHGSGCSTTTTVSSTTGSEKTSVGGTREETAPPESGCRQSQEEAGPSRDRRTSVNIEYGDEVDGDIPIFQVNLETNETQTPLPPHQAPEEDSFSVQYDSDQFAVEYELETSDHRSESEHSSRESTKPDYLVVQKESDVEFWADYSDTETNSDGELEDADLWKCEICGTHNVPFYRNCSKCWTLRLHWLPESSRPSAQLPAEPKGIQDGYYAVSSESNDEQFGFSRRSLEHWKPGEKLRRRRIRVVSASSSDRNSESLVSLSEDEAASTSVGGKGLQNSASLLSSESLTASQGNVEEASLSQNKSACESPDRRRRGGGKWETGRKDSDLVAPSADVCVVCACRPKTGSIIHGNSGHQICCYRCAKRLKQKGLPCPVCRRPIQKVVKNFVL